MKFYIFQHSSVSAGSKRPNQNIQLPKYISSFISINLKLKKKIGGWLGVPVLQLASRFKNFDTHLWSIILILKSCARNASVSDIFNWPPQDVDVFAVLDFQIPCFRPEIPALYLRSLLINYKGHEQKQGRPWRRPWRLHWRKRGLQRSRKARTSMFRGALIFIKVQCIHDLNHFIA